MRGRRKVSTVAAACGLLIGGAGLVLSTTGARAQGNSGTVIWTDTAAGGFFNRNQQMTWTLDKSVNPSQIDVTPNGSADVVTTLSATKTVGGQTDTLGVQGQVVVVNMGSAPTKDLTIYSQVQYSGADGNWRPLKSCIVSNSQAPVLNPGQSCQYAFQIKFAPVSGATAYRNVVQPAITNFNGTYMGMPAGPIAGQMFQQPTSPTSLQVVDASALVQDTTPAPSGFIRQDSASTGGQFTGQCKFTNTGSFQYKSHFTNQGVQKGKSFSLSTPATLVTGDTGKQTQDQSQLQVTTGTPDVPQQSSQPTALWIDSSTSGFNNQELTYGWTLDKTVTPVALQVSPGQTANIQTTLTATKSLTGQTQTQGVQGQVSVVNVGGAQTQNLQVFSQIQCCGSDGVWKALKTSLIDTSQKSTLAAGQTGTYPFSINFTPPAGMVAWRHVCLAAITNHIGWYAGMPAGPATGSSFQPPSNPTSVKVKGQTAQATGTTQVPPGFKSTDKTQTGQQSTGQFQFTNTGQAQYTTQLQNTSAQTGQHFTIENPSTLIVNDTGQTTSDTGTLEVVTGPTSGQ
jgi:hypothetical protein